MERLAKEVNPWASEGLRKIDTELLGVLHPVFNLLACLAVYLGSFWLPWLPFGVLLLSIGVASQILTWEGEKRADAAYSRPPPQSGESEEGLFGTEPVSEICLGDLRPTLNWLNDIVGLLWRKHRAFARVQIMGLWADLNLEARGLRCHDFDLGDRPPVVRTINISPMDNCSDLVLDLDLAYDGNMSASVSLASQALKVSVPVTVKNVSVRKLQLRAVLRSLHDRPPFIGGVQGRALDTSC